MDDGQEPRRLSGRMREAAAAESRAERRRPPPPGMGRGGRLVAAAALVAIGALSATGVLLYMGEIPAGPFASDQPGGEAGAPAVIPEGNLVARQAQQWGVADCLAQTAAVLDFLTRNMEYSWLARRGETDANRELFSATIAGREQGSGIQGLSGFFAAPVGNGRCNAGYQTTMYFADTCVRTREIVFPTFSSRIEFGNIAEAYATPGGQATVYLLPAGAAGCVAVKSELFY